jgi:glycosyltransferase involved in cell wall biosynthesis
MAKVDVIVPFYNTPIEFVAEALDSIRKQTETDWCAIVVNDGSQIASSTALESLLESMCDSRFIYLKTANQGLAAARNNGIRAGCAPFIALLDSDDAWYPARLQEGVAALERNPDAAVSHAAVDLIMPDGTVRECASTERPDAVKERFGQFQAMLEQNFVGVVTTTIRRSACESAGLFDPQFDALEDKELWCRMLCYGARFEYIPKVVARYRLHATNMSKNWEKMARGRRLLISKLDWLLRETDLMSAAQWSKQRRRMVHHIAHEIAETLLEKNDPWNAIRYMVPWRAGVSRTSMLLTLRSFYRGVYKALDR